MPRSATSLRADLTEKYGRLLALRRAHAPGPPAPTLVAELRDVARRWPGALRELDALPLEVLRARLDALAADGAPAPWMRAQAEFHAQARGALAAKRWLGKRREVTTSLRASFVAWAGNAPERAEASAWADRLEAVAQPPGGRLTALVHARVAEALGTSDAEARRLVLPPRPND